MDDEGERAETLEPEEEVAADTTNVNLRRGASLRIPSTTDAKGKPRKTDKQVSR